MTDGADTAAETAHDTVAGAPAPALLETRGLSVRFGGVKANDDLAIRVPAGRLVGLIGPNGAGKTTFVDAITGYVASTGTVLFDGDDISGLAPHERARRGLVRTFQSLELFDDLTVEDNLLVAAEPPRWSDLFADLVRVRRPGRAVRERVHHALDVVGLAAARDLLPTELSHGQRKLVGVARALASAPKLLLLDEPAAGLDSAESRLLGSRLRGLVDGGTTLFLIDHDMGLVLDVCDELYVLDYGTVIAHGTPAAVRADARVVQAYLGSAAEARR